MDRRYYRLKALIVVVAMTMAAASAFMGLPYIPDSPGHIHYGAAAAVQTELARTALRVTHNLGIAMQHAACSIGF